MKYQILFGVVFLTLLSYCFSEIDEDFESYVGEKSILAEEQTRKDDENCIAKHHECTNNRHGCCRGKMFKYKCHCVTIVNDQKEETERCACITPTHHKATEFVVQLFKKIF